MSKGFTGGEKCQKVPTRFKPIIFKTQLGVQAGQITNVKKKIFMPKFETS